VCCSNIEKVAINLLVSSAKLDVQFLV